MATISAEHSLALLADNYAGGMWRFSIYNGAAELVFTDPRMDGTAEVPTGVDDICVRPGELYSTNSTMAFFGVTDIDPLTGIKTGNATIIASGLSVPDGSELLEPASARWAGDAEDGA